MYEIECDNCNNIIHFKESQWRNGDIYCKDCYYLYEDPRSVAQMEDVTDFVERRD